MTTRETAANASSEEDDDGIGVGLRLESPEPPPVEAEDSAERLSSASGTAAREVSV